MIKKILLIFTFFFIFSSESSAFTGDILPVTTETFIELDYSIFNYTGSLVDTGSGNLIIDYSNQLGDISKMLYQIKILLFIIGFFVLLFVFTSLINDLLGKR